MRDDHFSAEEHYQNDRNVTFTTIFVLHLFCCRVSVICMQYAVKRSVGVFGFISTTLLCTNKIKLVEMRSYQLDTETSIT